ncbi:MAG TPA: hypothetical protein VLM85_12535 [Polyangiaceae bacterium]|nr:hypothetical protein [Polyangiaceae bacterium]
MAKKKKSALAAAASRKLAGIGGPKMSPQDVAHVLWHAEQRGEVERVPLEDGSWAWVMNGPDGKPQMLKPTPEMLQVLEGFEREGHGEHG